MNPVVEAALISGGCSLAGAVVSSLAIGHKIEAETGFDAEEAPRRTLGSSSLLTEARASGVVTIQGRMQVIPLIPVH
jgi:hypothetical protein